ncbi:hypothetical protein J3F84DRAFT_2604 [Trichoderma pleuroticola]
MIRRPTRRLHIVRVSKTFLVKKTVPTPLRYTTTIWPSTQCYNVGIGDNASHPYTSCSSLEEKRDTLTSLDDHDLASIDALRFTTLNHESRSVGENNCKHHMEALGSISDSDCRTSSDYSDITRHYDSESQMEKGRHQDMGLSLSSDATFTTTAALIRQTTDPLYTAGATYRCATETYGCTEVRVGTGDCIPRRCRDSVLSYTVDHESFPTPADAICVKEAMQKAACMWGGIAVPFKEVDCRDSATFVVKYHPREWRAVYARAFFPDELPSELLVYNLALSNATYLANILAHELGHILGLRHEFADEDKQERKLRCVLFGKKNSRSIMNYYKDLGQLQVSEQDLKELEAFYAYDGEKYKGLLIHDYDPILRKRISRQEAHSSHAMKKSDRRFSYRNLLGKLDSFISETLHAVK